jgi:hypothetical protein
MWSIFIDAQGIICYVLLQQYIYIFISADVTLGDSFAFL